MLAPAPIITKERVDAELGLMRQHSKRIHKSKKDATDFLIRAGLFTKSGKPRNKFIGGGADDMPGA